jgi:hypothetical protein
MEKRPAQLLEFAMIVPPWNIRARIEISAAECSTIDYRVSWYANRIRGLALIPAHIYPW